MAESMACSVGVAQISFSVRLPALAQSIAMAGSDTTRDSMIPHKIDPSVRRMTAP